MVNRSNNRNKWTIKEILDWTTGYFQEKGVATPRLDVEILLAHSLDRDRLFLYLNLDRPLSPEERARFRELVTRRARREPVALIIGSKEFWSIPLRMVPGILIPRPETELLVERVVERVISIPSPRVLEIGTGSGAVAVAIASEDDRTSVVATDVSAVALETARHNAIQAGVADSIDIVASDLCNAVRQGEHFDVICSNPPYIPSADIAGLEPEVRDFEPQAALDGGPDGLTVIRELAALAPGVLKHEGALLFEIGAGQYEMVRELLVNTGRYSQVQVFPDLAGIPRVVEAIAVK